MMVPQLKYNKNSYLSDDGLRGRQGLSLQGVER
jgi:hypothetical protein